MVLSDARRERFPFPSFLPFLVAALLAPLPPPGSLRLAIRGARLAGAWLSATLDARSSVWFPAVTILLPSFPPSLFLVVVVLPAPSPPPGLLRRAFREARLEGGRF